MARENKFYWNPKGYTEVLQSEGVYRYLSAVASEITKEANESSQIKRTNRTNFAYKVLPGDKKLVAIIHTASFPGMLEQSKYNTLKKALMRHKQSGGVING